MKLETETRILAFLFFLLMSPSYSLAQESKPTARLIDEYEKENWEVGRAYLDAAVQQFQSELNSKLFIIIYGKPQYVWRKTRTVKDYLKNNRGLKDEVVTVVEGGEDAPFTTQIWIVPQGAENPMPKSLVSYSEMKSRPYVIGQDIYGADDGDEWVYESFAEELEKNPTAQGYLVFYKDKYVDGSSNLKDTKSKLIKEYKIHSSRIRVITSKDDSAGRIEFWIVPEGQSFRLPQKQKSAKKNQ